MSPALSRTQSLTTARVLFQSPKPKLKQNRAELNPSPSSQSDPEAWTAQKDEQGRQQLPPASRLLGGVGWGQPSLDWQQQGLSMVVTIVPHSQTKAWLRKEWASARALPVRGQLVVNPRPQAITIEGSSMSSLGPGSLGHTALHSRTHSYIHTYRQFLSNTPTQESEF